MIVADIDYDDAARHVGKQPPRKIGDGLRWDRKDDDFSGFGGVDNGSGGRADLSRQRGQALRSSRVRNRDVMAELGEVACKYPSHASSADDSNSHVDSLASGEPFLLCHGLAVFDSVDGFDFGHNGLCFIWDTFQTLATRDSFGPMGARLRSTHLLAG